MKKFGKWSTDDRMQYTDVVKKQKDKKKDDYI